MVSHSAVAPIDRGLPPSMPTSAEWNHEVAVIDSRVRCKEAGSHRKEPISDPMEPDRPPVQPGIRRNSIQECPKRHEQRPHRISERQLFDPTAPLFDPALSLFDPALPPFDPAVPPFDQRVTEINPTVAAIDQAATRNDPTAAEIDSDRCADSVPSRLYSRRRAAVR